MFVLCMGNVFERGKKVYPLVFNKITLEGEEECSICLEKLNNNHVSLPCKHHFHENCITKWFDNKHECPLCREKYRLVLTRETYNYNAN